MIDDNDFEEDIPIDISGPKRKKLMLLLLPLLIVIGISVGIYFALNNSYDSLGKSYNVIQYGKGTDNDITVFFDLPELKTVIMNNGVSLNLRLKITLELSSIEDLHIIEILSPKLNDIVLGHTIELRLEEINGTEGLYWLKEELLYRFNLAASPVKIKDLNFSVFEIQK